jgi:ribonuclease P protein component
VSSHLRFSKAQRLNDPKQFQDVFAKGQRIFFKPGMFIVLPNQLGWARFGQIIAKKKVKTAVARNVIKRLQRELFRQTQQLLAGYDIVFVASNTISKLTRDELYSLSQLSWQNLAKKLPNGTQQS